MAKKQRSSVVGVLDIGSTKVVCFIARIGPQDRIEILGIGHNVANGIKAGRITDIKAAETSIALAVEAAEQMSGEKIRKVYVSLSSNNLISQRHHSELMIAGHEINDKDLNRLLLQILDKHNDQELEVIHSFAYDYMLDGNRGIDNPLGMYGNHLSGDFHVISAPVTHLLNINNCIARCQLEVENYISTSYASGIACLTSDETALGSTLIEFGGGCTSISVFNRGHMLYTDAIPIGGLHVTNDIARGLATDFASAERIKTLYGTTILTSADSNEIIEVPLSAANDYGEMSLIKRAELVEIIRARVEEIIEIIIKKMQASGMQKLAGNKIVITGGGAQLIGMKEIVGHMFSKNVRIGYPRTLNGLAESTSGISFATPIGMLIHISEFERNTASALSQTPANDSGPFSNVFNWFKENFG
jgi:cell division protein FtsA